VLTQGGCQVAETKNRQKSDYAKNAKNGKGSLVKRENTKNTKPADCHSEKTKRRKSQKAPLFLSEMAKFFS
jgi:hypothetical protein